MCQGSASGSGEGSPQDSRYRAHLRTPSSVFVLEGGIIVDLLDMTEHRISNLPILRVAGFFRELASAGDSRNSRQKCSGNRLQSNPTSNEELPYPKSQVAQGPAVRPVASYHAH